MPVVVKLKVGGCCAVPNVDWQMLETEIIDISSCRIYICMTTVLLLVRLECGDYTPAFFIPTLITEGTWGLCRHLVPIADWREGTTMQRYPTARKMRAAMQTVCNLRENVGKVAIARCSLLKATWVVVACFKAFMRIFVRALKMVYCVDSVFRVYICYGRVLINVWARNCNLEKNSAYLAGSDVGVVLAHGRGKHPTWKVVKSA